MASYKYSTSINEHMAKASLRAEPISTKHSVEICNMLRGIALSRAKNILDEVVSMKKAVPFKRYNDNVGHRKGMGPGRYPVKAASKILSLIKTVEANAQVKGLDTESLVIKHICSHLASRPMRYGRHRGRMSKRTHVEVVVMESPQLKEKKTKKGSKVQQVKKEEIKEDKSKVEEKEKKIEDQNNLNKSKEEKND